MFVEERPFNCDAFYKHANVQSKAVFSYAMTVMDKICGWTDEEEWEGSKFAACMWIHTKTVLTPTRNAGVSEAEDVNHHAERELGLCRNFRRPRMNARKHNCQLRFLLKCMLWFPAPTQLKWEMEGEEMKIEKLLRSCEHGDCRSDLCAFWRFPHTAYVHVDNSGCSLAQDGCEQGNEGLENGRETCTPAFCRWS